MIMAGNPNWWSMHPPSSQSYVLGSSSSSIPMNFFTDSQETPHSWSQMLFAGLPGEEERMVGSNNHFEESNKKMENNWEEQIILNNTNPSSTSSSSRLSLVDVIKQEVGGSGGGNNLYGGGHGGSDQEFSSSSGSAYWLNNNMMTIMPPVTIPYNKSRPIPTTTTSSSSNNTSDILDFTHNNNNNNKPLHNNNNPSSQSNKKARVQASPTQPPLKVRKEKLGDRITALHQLVSPFGKTDTASVLLEAIGYIRFLQGQIEALSSPYMSNASKNIRNQHSVHGERNSVFPEDPGQLLNDTGLKRKGASSNQEVGEEKGKDLRSRGLCLVPVSCTQHHAGDENNGADYWAPAYATGF